MSDTEEIQEKVAAAFCEPAHRHRWPLALIDSYCGQCWERAEAVLPLIAREKAGAVREAASGLSWFGAQGNTLDHLTSWQVVAECMKALRNVADGIEQEADRG